MIDELLDALEHGILNGRARWIADLNETFRDYSVGGHKFEIHARGQTRGKGFILSRFFAWTVLPNYKVSLYARAVRNTTTFLRGNLIEFLKVIKKDLESRGMKWAWLVLLFDGDPPDRISSMVQEYSKNDIGIGCINAYSGNMVVSNNVLGRGLIKQMRLHKLVSELEHSKERKGSVS